MAEAADRAGLLLIEAFHYRYHPVFLRALEIYRGGQIGDLVRLSGFFHVGLGDREMPAGDIRMIYETGGGATMDMGCYPMSWVRHFTGEEPEVVSAEAVEGPPDVDLRLVTELQFPGGATGSTSGSMMKGDTFRAELIAEGTEGTLTVVNPLVPHVGHEVKLDSRRRELLRDPRPENHLRLSARRLRACPAHRRDIAHRRQRRRQANAPDRCRVPSLGHEGSRDLTVADIQDIIEQAWERRDAISFDTRGPVRDAVAEALDALDSGRVRVAEKLGGDWVVNQWLKKAVLLSFLLNDMDTVDGGPWRGALVGQGAVEVRRLGRSPVPGRRLPRGAIRHRAPLGIHRAVRGAHAELRQPRGVRGQRHHDRHLGDRRFLRADRQELPRLRRRRYRRRPRAAAGGAGDRRGQLLHRRAFRGRRGRDRRTGRGARHGRVHRRVDQDR